MLFCRLFLVMTLVVVEVNMLGVGQAVSWKALITCSFLVSKQMHSIVSWTFSGCFGNFSIQFMITGNL